MKHWAEYVGDDGEADALFVGQLEGEIEDLRRERDALRQACRSALEELDSVGGDVPAAFDQAATILRRAINGKGA